MGIGNLVLNTQLKQVHAETNTNTVDTSNMLQASFLKRGKLPVLPFFEDFQGPFFFSSGLVNTLGCYGGSHRLELPLRNGHVLANVVLHARFNRTGIADDRLPEYFYSYIDYVSISIDSLEIERLHSHSMFIHHTILASPAQRNVLEEISICRDNPQNVVSIPLAFSFSESTSSYLPLFAIPDNSILTVTVVLKSTAQLAEAGYDPVPFEEFNIFARYCDISATEIKSLSASLEHSYLDIYLQPYQYMLDQHLSNNAGEYTLRLGFSGRITELFWMIESKNNTSYNRFNYWNNGLMLVDHIKSARFLQERQEQEPRLSALFFRTMNTFQIHRGQGLQTWRQVQDPAINTEANTMRRLGSGIYSKRYALYPDYSTIQPNGFLYLDATLTFELNLDLAAHRDTASRVMHLFARSLQVLRFDGKCPPKFI